MKKASIVKFKKYLCVVSDAGTGQGMPGLNEELGRHRGREGKGGRSVCFVMQSVRVLVMRCGIVPLMLVLEVPQC